MFWREALLAGQRYTPYTNTKILRVELDDGPRVLLVVPISSQLLEYKVKQAHYKIFCVYFVSKNTKCRAS